MPDYGHKNSPSGFILREAKLRLTFSESYPVPSYFFNSQVSSDSQTPQNDMFIHTSWGPALESTWSCCRKQMAVLPNRDDLFALQLSAGVWLLVEREPLTAQVASRGTQSCFITGSMEPHTNKISYPGAAAMPETS